MGAPAPFSGGAGLGFELPRAELQVRLQQEGKIQLIRPCPGRAGKGLQQQDMSRYKAAVWTNPLSCSADLCLFQHCTRTHKFLSVPWVKHHSSSHHLSPALSPEDTSGTLDDLVQSQPCCGSWQSLRSTGCAMGTSQGTGGGTFALLRPLLVCDFKPQPSSEHEPKL